MSRHGAWRAGGVVDAYRLLEPIGEGGMGQVFRAERVGVPGSECCVKSLTIPRDPEALLRFQREGQAQAHVDAHPNVVRVHALGVAEGRPYLVTDLADGGDLAARLRQGPLPPDEAARLVRDLARGLAHVHARGVLHRDLKPGNVLFAGGVPQLTDFGIAKVTGAESLTATGAVLGTPAYMAPEQLRGEADERTDVYGLGAILYHCLTGRPPFAGVPLRILAQVAQEPPAPVRRLRSEVPSGLAAVCATALEKDPARRQPSAEALAEALDAWLALPTAPRGPATWLAAGGALLIVAAAVVVAVASAGSPSQVAEEREGPAPPASPTPAARRSPEASTPLPGETPAHELLRPLDARERRMIEEEQARFREVLLGPQALAIAASKAARRYEQRGEARVAVALYREALRRGCPPSESRHVLEPLAKLLRSVPGCEAEVRRYVLEALVRDQSWALRAVAATGAGRSEWAGALPQVTPAIGAAAAVIHACDGRGKIDLPDPNLQFGAARRRLEAFVLRRLDPGPEVRGFLARRRLGQAVPGHVVGDWLLARAKPALLRGEVSLPLLAMLRVAVANHSGGAMARLAELYAKGHGVRERPDVALRLLLTGACQGDPQCLQRVALGLLPPERPPLWWSTLGLGEDRPLAAQCLAAALPAASPRRRKDLQKTAARFGLTLSGQARPDLAGLLKRHELRNWFD